MRLQAIAIVAANILLGSACQSSNSPSTSNSTTGPTIVYAVSHLAVTMDPCFIPGGNETSEVNNWLYLAWDYNPVTTANGPIPMDDVTSAFKGNMVPGLLTSWELSSDQLTWTLHIRKGVVDSYGNEVKAKFAKWVLERVNKAGGCSYWTNALGVPDAASQVTVVDDYTLRVQLKTPNAIFLNVLNSNSGLVMGPEVMKHVTTADPWGTQWLRQNAPATGPYLLKSWTPGVEQVFVRNPKYIGPNPAQIGKIIYRLVPDASVRVTLLLSGQAQVARDLSPQNIKQISDSKKAVAHCVAGNRYVYAAFNVTPGHPTENLLLRQALNYAVPYDDVINSVYNGTATRLYGFAPPITNGYLGQSAFPYRYDLTKASNVLAQSGLHNVRLTLLINNTFPEHQQIAVLLQNSFSKIGVSLTIDKKPAAAWYDQAASRS
ncbi:MAG TPA: ABC transporter substrate-binding protein, partial [Blastocatellia bacterium]|nr:ABC transporter substrate-binding protein [Blastocatellia bacterium]